MIVPNGFFRCLSTRNQVMAMSLPLPQPPHGLCWELDQVLLLPPSLVE